MSGRFKRPERVPSAKPAEGVEGAQGNREEIRRRRRLRREELRDHSVRQGRERRQRIDLGLALLQHRAIPGVPLTHEDIAAWAGCTAGAILWIESRALLKLRRALHMRKDPLLLELLRDVLQEQHAERRAAQRVPGSAPFSPF